MQTRYDIAATKAAKALLTSMGISFTPQADGSLFVPGSIDLSNKNLKELPDLSMVDVGKDFFCDGNHLKDLTGAPRSVAGAVDCSRNELVSLKGAPPQCATFDCSGNKLTSLEFGPEAVSSLYCDNNPLTSLEHAPKIFAEIISDFGGHNSWDEIPEDIRLSPETRQRLIDEAEAPIRAMEAAVRSVTILSTPITVSRALKFKR
jgi:hypothetical protein